MSDIPSFEDRFARQLRSYADRNSFELDRATVAELVANGVAMRRRARPRRLVWPIGLRGRPVLARAAAIGALALVTVIGVAVWIGGGRLISPPATMAPPASVPGSLEPSGGPSPSRTTTPSPEDALGWPTTGANAPGVYSWGGARCSDIGRSCNIGFMHNGYGAGDVAITIRELSEQPDLPGATAVTFVGHSALYRRFLEPEPSYAWGSMLGPVEVWIVDIDGVLLEVAIRPDSDSGISDASLADAHAIIGSMRYERTNRPTHGFRLLFTLANGEWDSG